MECTPWAVQCKAVFYGWWWKNRSLVVKDKRQITMDSGGPSDKIPSDQDGYPGQARSCSVGDPIQGVLQHRWKNIYIPEQGEQMQKETRLHYYLIFLLTCMFIHTKRVMKVVTVIDRKVKMHKLQQQHTYRFNGEEEYLYWMTITENSVVYIVVH